MAQFPRNARAGQTHRKFGRKFVYSETTEAWTPVVPLASVAEVKRTAAANTSAVTTYSLASQLPLSDNTTGALAFVSETNRLYVWSGTGWYNVATIESAGSSISGVSASYTLATDGTPTVVTLSQSGLTSPTWSYAVTSGSLGRTATVTQADNVFTITPSTLAKNVGSFGLTFKATDGSNTIVKNSQFTMSNTAPVIGTGPNATYSLASDGTPTVITLAATDADGHAITWSYEVVSGSLGGTTVSIVGSVFTITPSSNQVDAGEFQLRFIASDGVSFDAEVSAFTLAFAPDWTATTLLHTLDNPNAFGTSDYDWFGNSVAVDGNYVIVGARYEDNATTTDLGVAYVFNATTGILIHTLNHPNPSIGAGLEGNMGTSVAIKGNYAVVGAYSDDANEPNSGAAYVFDVTSGTLVYTLTPPSVGSYGGGGAEFGRSIGISDTYIIVGAWKQNVTAPHYREGCTHIYNLSNGSLVRTLQNPNADTTTRLDDNFGSAVAIDGNYAVVSAVNEENSLYGSTKTAAGQVYIFDVTTGTKLHNLSLINDSNTIQNYAYFGWSVSISGDYCIVGAYRWADGTGGNGVGRAFVFSASTGNLQYTFTNPINTTPVGNFGNSVATDGSYAFIGAPSQLGTGKVYVYDLSNGLLIKTIDNANAYGTGTEDYFGYSVAISGNYVIVSALGEDDASGTHSGKAYIFQAG